jgi:hypothetical protein
MLNSIFSFSKKARIWFLKQINSGSGFETQTQFVSSSSENGLKNPWLIANEPSGKP